jgi:hypothetical protein
LLTAPSNPAPRSNEGANTPQKAAFMGPRVMTFKSHSTMPSRRPVKRIKQINAFISAKCRAEAVLVCFR